MESHAAALSFDVDIPFLLAFRMWKGKLCGTPLWKLSAAPQMLKTMILSFPLARCQLSRALEQFHAPQKRATRPRALYKPWHPLKGRDPNTWQQQVWPPCICSAKERTGMSSRVYFVSLSRILLGWLVKIVCGMLRDLVVVTVISSNFWCDCGVVDYMGLACHRHGFQWCSLLISPFILCVIGLSPAEYTYGNHPAWGSYPHHQNMTAQGHCSERYNWAHIQASPLRF